MTAFIAKYYGTCAEANCGQKVSPGESVRYIDGELVHEECPPTLTEETRPPCPKCWLVHAGECF